MAECEFQSQGAGLKTIINNVSTYSQDDKNLVIGVPKHFSTSTQVGNIQGTSASKNDARFVIPNFKKKYQAVSGSHRNTSIMDLLR